MPRPAPERTGPDVHFVALTGTTVRRVTVH